MPEFKVIIGQNEFAKASCYSDITNCPICVKMRSLFPTEKISAGGTYVNISERRIVMEGWTLTTGGELNAFEVNDRIRDAYNGVLVEKVEVTFPDFPQDLLDTLKTETL